jgi:hypothetical protein
LSLSWFVPFRPLSSVLIAIVPQANLLSNRAILSSFNCDPLAVLSVPVAVLACIRFLFKSLSIGENSRFSIEWDINQNHAYGDIDDNVEELDRESLNVLSLISVVVPNFKHD